jgi:hypothetical protein
LLIISFFFLFGAQYVFIPMIVSFFSFSGPGILKEIQAHKENKSYKFIDITKLPPGSNVINTGFVFDINMTPLPKLK